MRQPTSIHSNHRIEVVTAGRVAGDEQIGKGEV